MHKSSAPGQALTSQRISPASEVSDGKKKVSKGSHADYNSTVASFYDGLANVYSAGRIPKVKVAAFDAIVKPGMTMVFAGAGCGQDAIYAAQLGARVTVVDVCEGMTNQAQANATRSLEKKDPEALARLTFLAEDLLALDGQFDVVVANFFLNTFRKGIFEAMADKLCALTKPGGKLVLGDFCRSKGNIFAKTYNRLHQYTAYVTFSILVRSRMQVHVSHDLPSIVKQRGLNVDNIQYFKLLGSACYWTITATKPS